jgi:hypothetical protein
MSKINEMVESILNLVKQDGDCKTEGGICYPKADFAYTPSDKPSTWKLRMAQGRPGNVTRSQLGNAAASFSPGGFRGKRVQIPQADQSKVKAKLRAAYTKLGVKREDMPNSIKALTDITIWKDTETGKYKCILAYSNNFRDNDNPPEIITTQSHKDFNKALSDGEWPMPELWLWHVDYPVGHVDFHTYDEKSGFSVAAATFEKEWAAEALMKSEDWDALSHGMPVVEIRRDKEDDSLIVRHRTKEISFLPRRAAANKLTFHYISKENAMKDEVKGLGDKRDDFVSLIGEEKTAELEASLSDKSEEAKQNGTEQKQQTEDVPEDQQPVTRKELFEALTYILDEVKALKQENAEKQEADEPQDLVAMLKAHSAIGKEETKVDGRTKEAKDGPAETPTQPKGKEAESVYGVPLLDKLLFNKQEYATKQRFNLGNLPPELLAAMTEASQQ